MPLGEIVLDFFDKLKSRQPRLRLAGLRVHGLPRADLVKVDMLVNGEMVDALSLIVHRSPAQTAGAAVVRQDARADPAADVRSAPSRRRSAPRSSPARHQAMRKNVLAKCYGGDISRKRKLLEKQKDGKKRMKQVGNVEIPQEAFLAILQVERCNVGYQNDIRRKAGAPAGGRP